MIRALRAILSASASRALAWHLALTVVSVALRAAGAVMLIPIVVELTGPEPARAWGWVGLLGAVTAAGWILDWVIARIAFSIGFDLLETGQHAVADRLVTVPLTWFTPRNTTTARSAIAATAPDLVGLIVYLVTPMLAAVLLPVGIAVALMGVSVPLGLAALAGVPLLLGAYAGTGALSRTADRRAAEANTALTERILEFARTQSALRASRRADPARSQVGEALSAQHGAGVRLLLAQVPGQILFTVASQLALLLLAGTAVALAVRGDISMAACVGLIVVLARYLEPFTALADLAGGIESSTGVLRKIRDVLEAPRVAEGASQEGPQQAPALELRDVGFAYSAQDAPVLDGLDLRLEAGTTTAIVGPSGSGKSTVLMLLAGLQQPTSGTVLLDGVDAADLTAQTRRESVSMVFQEPYLFDGTIEENILVGRPDASAEAVAAATRQARVDPVAARLPDGMDTRAGEAGGLLSGGERQRVSIARALLKPAPLLLVDEATSALDTENEAAVTGALAQQDRPRTTVIVAHRLASIAAADRVVFLERGRILEDGTVPELLAAGGRFAELWGQREAAAGWLLRKD